MSIRGALGNGQDVILLVMELVAQRNKNISSKYLLCPSHKFQLSAYLGNLIPVSKKVSNVAHGLERILFDFVLPHTNMRCCYRPFVRLSGISIRLGLSGNHPGPMKARRSKTKSRYDTF
jgi:hypothetical protein